MTREPSPPSGARNTKRIRRDARCVVCAFEHTGRRAESVEPGARRRRGVPRETDSRHSLALHPSVGLLAQSREHSAPAASDQNRGRRRARRTAPRRAAPRRVASASGGGRGGLAGSTERSRALSGRDRARANERSGRACARESERTRAGGRREREREKDARAWTERETER